MGVYSNVRHSATSVAGDISTTNTAGSNSGNKVYGNQISNVALGIVFVGSPATATMDAGNDIGGTASSTGNTITNWGNNAIASGNFNGLSGAIMGIIATNQTGVKINYNTLTSASVNSSSGYRGIFVEYSTAPTSGSFTTDVTNNTVTLTNTGTPGTYEGIRTQGMTTSLSGCTINVTDNTILNCSAAGAFTAIINSSSPGTVNLNSNIIRGTTLTGTTYDFTGIRNNGSVVTTINMNSNKLGDVNGGALTFTAATSGSIYGIYNSATGSNTTALNIKTNDFRGFTHALQGSGTHQFIYNTVVTGSQDISSNTFTSLILNTTGSVYFIWENSPSFVSGTTITVSSNSIANSFAKTGSTGTVYFFNAGASSVAGVTYTQQNNNFSNVTLTGTTALTGWYNLDGSASPYPTKNITGNTFSNITGGSGTITVMNLNYFGGTGTSSSVSNNTITNITSTGGAITGISIGTSVAAANGLFIQGNTIGSLSTTFSGSQAVTGIQLAGAAASIINTNKNKIYDLSSSGAASSVYGIYVASGSQNIYNNLIGDIRATASSLAAPAPSIAGIYSNSSTTTSTIKVYYNTIYLNGTSTGATFSSACVYHTYSGTATTAQLDLRSNILINTSTRNGATGRSVCLQRSGTNATMNWATTSDFNLYYAGTASANNLLYYDGANTTAQTKATYASTTNVGTFRDANCRVITSNLGFYSTNGATPGFLHVDPTDANAVSDVESKGGALVASPYDVDYDGTTRSSTTDIGADEFTLPSVDAGVTSVTLTGITSPVCPASNATVTAVVKNFGSTTLTSVTLTYTPYVGSVAGTPVAQTFPVSLAQGVSSGTLTFTTPYTFGNNAGKTIYISVTASLANGGGSDVTTVNDTYVSSNYLTQLTGTQTVGAGQTFLTITSAVAYANTNGICGPTVFSLTDANYPETFPITINQLTGSSTTNTLTIKPASNVNATVTGSLTGGGIVLNGADNIIIDGSNAVNGTTRNLTITNSSTTSGAAAILLTSLGAGAGATGNTIKNCNISTGAASGASYAISVGGTPGVSGADNDNTTIQNNNITVSTVGIYAVGTAAGTSGGNDNLGITGNTITNISAGSTTIYGIRVGNTLTSSVSQNTIAMQTSSGCVPVGISLDAGFVSSSVTRNNITNVSTTSSGLWGARGITVSTGSNSALTIANNFISGVNGSNNVSFGSSTAGIAIGVDGNTTTVNSVATGVKLYYNSINLTGNYLASGNSGAALTAAVYIGSAAGSLDIRNNIFSNSLNNQNATGTASKNYAVYSAATTSAFSTMDYNNYYVTGTQGKIANIGAADKTFADLQTGGAFGAANNANAQNLDPQFASTSDLHISTTGSNMNQKGQAISGQADDFDATNVRCTSGCSGSTIPDIGADEFTPPACLPPVITSVTPGGTGAVVAFTCTSCTPGNAFIVEYGVGAFTPGTGATAGGGTVVTGTGSPITIPASGSLTPGASYNVYVRQDCSGASNGYSNNSTVSSFIAAPANDNCAQATTLTLNAAAVSGTFVSANSTVSGATKKEVWYKFTPVCNGNHTITINGFSPAGNRDLYVFTSCPSTWTGWSFSGTNTSTTTEALTISLTAGTPYYVAVYDIGDFGGTFNIAVTSAASPGVNLTNTTNVPPTQNAI